ncbi:MAG TPA: hypothetical protein DCS31_07985, partial [Candidatus Competibacteraceae bacterium]|nr:hypothetical protein [Candidatus Competibacteraceae bacterium]
WIGDQTIRELLSIQKTLNGIRKVHANAPSFRSPDKKRHIIIIALLRRIVRVNKSEFVERETSNQEHQPGWAK